MILRAVNLQQSSGHETFIANVTLIRPLLAVYRSNVDGERRFLIETLAANRAHVRFLLGVDANMRRQVARFDEALPANVASVRLFPRVDHAVVAQANAVTESHSANFADVFLLGQARMVPAHVLLLRRFGGERLLAELAHRVHVIGIVHFFVYQKVVVVAINLFAKVAIVCNTLVDGFHVFFVTAFDGKRLIAYLAVVEGGFFVDVVFVVLQTGLRFERQLALVALVVSFGRVGV